MWELYRIVLMIMENQMEDQFVFLSSIPERDLDSLLLSLLEMWCSLIDNNADLREVGGKDEYRLWGR